MAPKNLLSKVLARSPAELAREAAKRLRTATRFERYARGRAGPPYAVSFWVTRRCNLNCAMCWVAQSRRLEGEQYLRAGEELTLAELQAVVDDLRRWRPRLGVTGGEPFLRPDLLDFLAYAKARGFRLGVNTNGSFLGRDAAALVEIGVDSLMVSVDGPPALHDGQRRSPGSFRAVQEGLAALAEAKGRRGARTPYVKVTCTITAANVASLAELPPLLADLALDELTFQHLWYTDRATADAQRALFRELFGQDTTYLQGFVVDDLPPLDVGLLRVQARALASTAAPVPVNFYPPLEEEAMVRFYADPRSPLRRPCFSRWLRVDLLPDGTVTPCLGLEAGNVRDRSLSVLWNGEVLRRFRAELASRKAFPGCSRCCGLFSD
ncbi:MAG: radical SAM protein [Candidatus Coatesbacteria bacterium]|nr:MAG: radical SAM protein [Candidatus Coatesbacteria bacterium]